MKKINIKDYFFLISPTPVFFSVSFVLAIYLQNISEVSLLALILPFVGVLIFSIIVNIFFVKILESKDKGTLISVIFLILFFSYGDAFWAINNNWIPLPKFLEHTDKNFIVQPIWILIFILALWVINYKIKNFEKIKKFILVISVLIFTNFLVQISYHELTEGIHTVNSTLALPQIDKNKLKNLPDIYYIMPEDYSSSSVMKKYFNYDNSSFINFLKSKGFFVPTNSTSNYPKTFESLASSLNMEYLDYMSKYNNSSDMTLVSNLINNNNVLRMVKLAGYQYYHVGSWWEFTNNNPYADENFSLESENTLPLDAFSCLVVESTQAVGLFNKIPHLNCEDSDQNKEDRIVYQFTTAADNAILRPSPKFVFLHVIAPHGPYVFGKGCSEVDGENLSNRPEYENYSAQADCIDKKLENLINKILETSKTPPVILLQSDEGAPFLNTSLNPVDSWKSADNALLQEKFPIFTAYFLPGASKGLLYDSITPVNSFRIVFNLYFHTNFPILPDKNYIFSDLNHLYNFTDVTNNLK